MDSGTEDSRAGIAGQMEAIMAEYEIGLLRYASRLLRSADAAQDVVQNAFIKLFKRLKAGQQPSAQLRSWLYRVTHNEAVDHIRRESRLRRLHDRQAEQAAAANPGLPGGACPDGVHCRLEREEKHALVLAELHRLSPGEQQVILLRLEEGLSYREISDVTGRSAGNVGCLLHHAVRKLARGLEGKR